MAECFIDEVSDVEMYILFIKTTDKYWVFIYSKEAANAIETDRKLGCVLFKSEKYTHK